MYRRSLRGLNYTFRISLLPGARLGPYEILSALGAGGMGEVYRARDSRLERDVAIKVLPPSFSADADRLARFQQEARAAAALNHPNILAVFDLGEHEGAPFIVSELLEGSTLRDRLASGAPPERKAAEYAIQIAQGLAAAHDRGIVHRDLKPENVFVTTDGLVKILDFGLAKLTQPAGMPGGATALPTTPALTGPGTVLGTLGYMAPEQIRGLTSDHRADIFAFGAVLYEMVSGSRAFAGATAADTMTAILTKDPPELTASGLSVSPALDRVIRHCLEKAPEERFQSARDLIFALKNASTPSHSSGVTQAPPVRRGRYISWPMVLAGTMTIIALVAAGALMRREPATVAAVQRFRLTMPGDAARRQNTTIRMSPDGRFIAFVDSGRGRGQRIWLRALDTPEPEPVRGTESGGQPFWSPDSRSIAFTQSGAIHRVDIPDGTPRRIATAKNGISGGAWADGFIVFASNADGVLYRVADTGGTPVQVTTLDQARGQRAHVWPQILPGGRHVMFYAAADAVEERGIWAQDLESGSKVFVTRSNGNGQLVGDQLLYRPHRENLSLLSQRFDRRGLAVSGTPQVLADGLEIVTTSFWGGFSSSDTGLLALEQVVRTRHQLRWFDRSGRALGAIGDVASAPEFALEPGGQRIVVRLDAAGVPDLWLLDHRGERVRLTYEGGYGPGWTRDGRLFFTQPNGGRATSMALTVGPAQSVAPFTGFSDLNRVRDVSTDRRLVLVQNTSQPVSIWIAAAADPKTLRPLVRDRFVATQGKFSPDGRWVAFRHNLPEGGEVFVQAVEGPTRVRISSAGGMGPVWRSDGSELYYESADGKVMAVPVETVGAEFRAGTPVALFAIRTQAVVTNQPRNFEVSADGQRFLVNTVVGDSDNAPIDLIVNWPALLKKN